MIVSKPEAPTKRRRRTMTEMRDLILQEARQLAASEGPQAVTLKAVATRSGVTHGNVTYHFGTIDALHTALITAIFDDLTAATAGAVAHLRRGEMNTRDVVDVVFDAFAVAGAGRLVVWLAATGADHRLTPFYAGIAELVGALAQSEAGRHAGGADGIGLMVATLVMSALSDSLIGADLVSALGLERDAVRQFAAEALATLRERRAASPG